VKEFGIVVFDLNGGDLAVHFVDGTRWNQILVANVSQCSGFSERRGALLKTVYTQRWVFEPVEEVEGRLLGILTL